MKLILALLISVVSFANTYELEKTITPEFNSDYQVMNTISLKNVTLVDADVFTRTVLFTAELNGKLENFKGTLVERINTTDGSEEFVVKGNLQRDHFSEGFCDSFETFSYDFEATLTIEVPTPVKYFAVDKLQLNHEYSWDNCHSTTQYNTLNYFKN